MKSQNQSEWSSHFRVPRHQDLPAMFMHGDVLWDDEMLARHMEVAAKAGIGCVIPLLSPPYTAADDAGLRQMGVLRERYARLLDEARRNRLDFSFIFEPVFEEIYFASHDELLEADAAARQLLPIEYICTPGETVQLLLRDDPLMSLVAWEESTGNVLDLRDFIVGRTLHWQAPEGNWRVIQYVCAACEEHRVDPLNYQASYDYLAYIYAFFADLFSPLRGNGFRAIGYRDLAFFAPNHRNWSPAFNDVFLARYGFDPAPYYPALFMQMGDKTEHMKALFLDCRAQMFRDGMLRAYADFAASRGVHVWGQVAEPKLPACSALSGDAMLNGSFSAGALLEKAYLYGVNSVKLAAGAAYNFGHDRVTCEIYRDYPEYPADVLYHEVASALSYGANAMLLHLIRERMGERPHLLPAAFQTFIARAQNLLRGGQHVADIAMLYPIYSLHAQVYFYQDDVKGFEYPNTPENADYMSLINSISIYAGHDLTLLHPETMCDFCHVEEDRLVMEGDGVEREEFRVLILPSAIMVRLENLRLAAAFFAAGGRIIATGALPRYAFEYDPDGENDREVCRLVKEIFGEDVLEGSVLRPYDYHRNAAGGEAYHLPAGLTALDGTEMVPGSLINETMKSLGLPYDVLLPGMIHLESSGALNLPYPEYVRLGLDRRIPGKGMLTHIHKRQGERDIYYFANTTSMDYDRPVLLRGAHRLEAWNPYTAEIRPLDVSFVTYKNTVYTKTRLSLASGSSIFYVAPEDVAPDRSAAIDSIEDLE